jgi:hypothetical protein
MIQTTMINPMTGHSVNSDHAQDLPTLRNILIVGMIDDHHGDRHELDQKRWLFPIAPLKRSY